LQYLSNADERMRWQANQLPSDDLCVENAIMLKRFNRYPLIIDPSGQATEFLMNEFKDRKITKTRYILAVTAFLTSRNDLSIPSASLMIPSARTLNLLCVSATLCLCRMLRAMIPS
jgi:hypothetical protein